MAPRAFRARLNTLTAVAGPARRRLPRRGINMLHKYKHKSINNFDEQQVTLALRTLFGLQRREIDNLRQLLRTKLRVAYF